jgi:hypothetical protein
MKAKLLLMAGMAVLLLSWPGIGQAQTLNGVQANIPFPFVVKGTTLPAGQYDFLPGDNEQYIKVVPAKKGTTIEAVIMTRLGMPQNSVKDNSHLVFDKIGNTYMLSELWIDGIDGFLLHATNTKHEHHAVKAKISPRA